MTQQNVQLLFHFSTQPQHSTNSLLAQPSSSDNVHIKLIRMV
jgi:hypothetical protein